MDTRPSGRSLNGELFRQVRSARLWVGAAVALGVLSAAATVAQMIYLSRIIDRALLKGAGLADVRGSLLLLLAAVLARAVLLWAREVVAGYGVVRVKSALRERLYAHLLRLVRRLGSWRPRLRMGWSASSRTSPGICRRLS
jgi:ATP-binding cassette, subfamily C, bacterial CydD